MLALTIRQPHVNAILSGEKTVENRTWPTRVRGDVALHVSKRRGGVLGGHVVAIVEIYDCVPVFDAPVTAHTSGPWCFLLRNIRPINPFPATGRLGFWKVEMR